MEIYIYYSIIIASAFIFFLYVYILYQKLLETLKKRKEKTYEKEIVPYIDELFMDIEQTYPDEKQILNLKAMVKVKIKRRIIINRIFYYLGIFTGSIRDNIVRLSEEIGLIHYEIKALKSKDDYKRILAIKNIGELRLKKAIPDLLKILNEKSVDIQYHTLMALAKIGNIEALTEALAKVGRRKLRISERSLIEIIDSFEGNKNELYNMMIDSPNTYLSTIFIKSAGNYMDTTLSNKISRYLKDKDKNRQIAAIKAIGQNGDLRFTQEIINKLKSEEWEVRAVAAKSLGRIGGKEALDSLVDALMDKEWWVRFNSARSLLQIPQGIDKLGKIMEGQDRFAKDTILSAMEDTGVIDDVYLYENAVEIEKRYLFEQIQKYRVEH